MTHAKPNAPDTCVVGVFNAMPAAEKAVRSLHAADFTSDHISLVARHINPNAKEAAELEMGDDSARDAAIGGALGGLAGVAGAATLLSITGIGLIVLTGPIVALTGVVVGALLGAMRGWGVHDAKIKEYEKLVEEGNVLVIVAGEPLEVEKAERLLKGTDARHVHLHAKSSTDAPGVDDRPSK